MKTYMQKPADVKRQWHLLDAKGQVLGQVATQAAKLLIGKDKATFTPHVDGGDYVVVINARQVAVTGKKEQDKMYYRHSGYPGGLKETNLANLRQKSPERIIEIAVKGMLPKNKLQKPRLNRLKVFASNDHPYQDKLVAKADK
jgi:large subunit ribosomal protein L13